MSDDATLTALLGSRICHDLISPIGAISNGVELVNMTGKAPGPEMSLIAQSVESANTHIRFFRIAFGSVGNGQQVAHREVAEIMASMNKIGRLTYNWLPETDLTRGDVKIAFLLIQCIESSLPYGGTVEISEDGGKWTLEAKADKLKAEADLWSIATNTGHAKGLTPGNVHFAIVAKELAARGRKLFADIRATSIRVQF